MNFHEAQPLRLYRLLDEDTKPSLLLRAQTLYKVDHPEADSINPKKPARPPAQILQFPLGSVRASEVAR
jgi:hypothetical protein